LRLFGFILELEILWLAQLSREQRWPIMRANLLGKVFFPFFRALRGMIIVTGTGTGTAIDTVTDTIIETVTPRFMSARAQQDPTASARPGRDIQTSRGPVRAYQGRPGRVRAGKELSGPGRDSQR
jgi:hypothetical protein